MDTALLEVKDVFAERHIGPREKDVRTMLEELGYDSLDALIDTAIPETIRLRRALAIPAGETEYDALAELRALAAQNRVFRSYIGAGYSDCITPPVILRNILENPGWYTAYTPYQAEISQGRLEALLNFQTVIVDLTGLPIANASLLDEATAAAEAMQMSHALTGSGRTVFFVSELCHPQTIEVVRTRAHARGVEVAVGDHDSFEFGPQVFGALLQYPATDGALHDYRSFCERAHAAGALVTVAADLLALTLIVPPGEFGADIAVGNTQRFGVPLGYGGPHAAYFATKDEFKRQLPGRIIGVSHDSSGRPALRMALQTREQHIRREKATSNICTAQVLLAVVAGMYAVYHGPDGLRAIAERVHGYASVLAAGLKRLGHDVTDHPFFDTVRVNLDAARVESAMAAAQARGINLRRLDAASVAIALDETVAARDIADLFDVFSTDGNSGLSVEEIAPDVSSDYTPSYRRESPYMTHSVFQRYRSETEMLRYMHRLESKDLSLTTSMIPLGSCTMKLNATAEMLPISWPEFARIHPFAPVDQTTGYREMFAQLESWLAEITGFERVSLQPNAGSQGEFAGLLVHRRAPRDSAE